MEEKEAAFIEECEIHGGLVRQLLDKQEIKMANRLVKQGRLWKGTSVDRQGTVTFFCN